MTEYYLCRDRRATLPEKEALLQQGTGGLVEGWGIQGGGLGREQSGARGLAGAPHSALVARARLSVRAGERGCRGAWRRERLRARAAPRTGKVRDA